ncbi:MAG: hypothetical protein ACKV2U_09000 [Bryobacteraceae bacterium]
MIHLRRRVGLADLRVQPIGRGRPKAIARFGNGATSTVTPVLAETLRETGQNIISGSRRMVRDPIA